MLNATKPSDRCAGSQGFAALSVTAQRSSSVARMRLKRIVNGISVRSAVLTSMTSPIQFSLTIISRYECGYCVCIWWDWTCQISKLLKNWTWIRTWCIIWRRSCTSGIALGKPEVQLSGDVECDEVYVTAGHKGNPEAVRKKGALDDVTDSKGFGVEVRSKRKNHRFLAWFNGVGKWWFGCVSSVKQTTIEPLIKATIVLGTQVYTDEYAIYNPLPEWGYKHKTVCHGAGEYARDDDGDGFCVKVDVKY